MSMYKLSKTMLVKLVKIFLLLSVLLFCAWIAYKPGLSGDFIFDDYHSLKKLAIFDGQINLQNSLQYLAGSDTGPLKRPISIFSFLLDAQDWPADTYSFKRTNVMLHLFNGVWLFLLIRQILSHHPKHRQFRHVVAFFAAGFWLLHPFLVSTTLYIVQRMAMLPVTFMLLGMVAYVWGRFRFDQTKSVLNSLILMAAVFGGTLLAMLSKENGVLFLPLMALFEVFILQKYLQLKRLPKKIKILLFYLPILILVIAFLVTLPGFMERYHAREFTAYERQLSQFRALTDYLYHIFVPKHFTYGVFTDGFKLSQSWFQPLSTFLSFIFICGLLLSAWMIRNRFIWISFSVFFFFIAHSIESTIIPLELYFEHRNYVAALFFGVPLGFGMVKLIDKTRVYYLIPLFILILLGFMTYIRSSVWSNNYKLYTMTMNKFPESVRAFTMTADIYARAGFQQRTISTLNKAIKYHHDLSLQLNRLQYLCQRENLAVSGYEIYFNKLFQDFSSVKFTKEDMVSYINLFKKLIRSECGTPDDKGYAIKLYESLLNNPAAESPYMKTLIDIYSMHYYVQTKQYEVLKVSINEILEKYHSYDDALEVAEILINEDNYFLAEFILKTVKTDYKRWIKLNSNIKSIDKQVSDLIDRLEEIR